MLVSSRLLSADQAAHYIIVKFFCSEFSDIDTINFVESHFENKQQQFLTKLSKQTINAFAQIIPDLFLIKSNGFISFDLSLQ